MMGFVAMCMVESPAAGASNLNLMLYIFLGVVVSSNQLVNLAEPPKVDPPYRTTDLRNSQAPLRRISTNIAYSFLGEVLLFGFSFLLE